MNKKIRIKVHEKMMRNNKGQLKCSYITALAPSQKITEDVAINSLSDRWKVSPSKVAFYLDETMQYAVKQLLLGNAVEIPQMGTFRLSIKSQATFRKMDAGEKSILKISVGFLPCQKVRKMFDLSNLQFKIENQ